MDDQHRLLHELVLTAWGEAQDDLMRDDTITDAIVSDPLTEVLEHQGIIVRMKRRHRHLETLSDDDILDLVSFQSPEYREWRRRGYR